MKSKEVVTDTLSLVAGPERSEGAATNDAPRSSEVSAKRRRRRYSAEDKRRVLREADACNKPGELGALIRREGIYSSTLSQWRAARQRGEIAGLTAKKRGPKAHAVDARDREIWQLQKENQKLKKRAERAEALVEIQKKVSQLLGIQLQSSDEDAS
jgi:transposase